MQLYVAIQGYEPVELCVTDDMDGLSCEVWREFEGIRTPILVLEANEPLAAAMEYLDHVPFPKDKLDCIVINTDEYCVYEQNDGKWKQVRG